MTVTVMPGLASTPSAEEHNLSEWRRFHGHLRLARAGDYWEYVEVALGSVAPSREELGDCMPRLREAITELVALVDEQSYGFPEGAAAEAIKRGKEALGLEPPSLASDPQGVARILCRRRSIREEPSLAAAQGHLRALGRVAMELLIVLSGDEA